MTWEDPQMRALVESIRAALPDGGRVSVTYRHDRLLLEVSVWAPLGWRVLWAPARRAFRAWCQERAFARARMRVPEHVGIRARWAKVSG